MVEKFISHMGRFSVPIAVHGAFISFHYSQRH